MNDNILNKITTSIENKILKIFEMVGLNKISETYKNHKEGMRYLVFGGLSTIINILIFMLLKGFFSTIISNTVAWIFSIIFAYITNKYCVFIKEIKSNKELFKEIVSFILFRLLTLIVDEIFMYYTIDILKYNQLLMKIIANIIVILLNYIFSKVIIFKNKSK